MFVILLLDIVRLDALIEIPLSQQFVMLFPITDMFSIRYNSISLMDILASDNIPTFPPDILLSVILQSLALTKIPTPSSLETKILNPEMEVVFAVESILKATLLDFIIAPSPTMERDLGTIISSEYVPFWTIIVLPASALSIADWIELPSLTVTGLAVKIASSLLPGAN